MKREYNMKRVIVLGASGATGQLLVKSLLQKGVSVIAIVRNKNKLKAIDTQHPDLQIVENEILKISEKDLSKYLLESEVVLSCLGHNLTFKGMFGQPRRLVTDSIKNVVKAIETIDVKNNYKIILMNTAGNSNRDIPEIPPFSQRFVISLLRYILPPHADNEEAADYLRIEIGQDHKNIEWVAVRPDGLINGDNVSNYDLFISPARNAIFNAGQTSRVNVADFMSDLAVKPALWEEWKGKMPVIYNQI
ncbi:MAG: NAD(P)-binding oxidoreductase [Candidatus Thiodiazotropha sp. L084R]